MNLNFRARFNFIGFHFYDFIAEVHPLHKCQFGDSKKKEREKNGELT